MAKPRGYGRADNQHRKDSLPEGGTYIKPMVTAKNSESTMAGGINFLNKVSVPFDIPCDELIFCYEGNFRLTCDGESYEIGPGDMMFVPKDNHIAYECDNVEDTMMEWKDNGYAEFLSEEPMTCPGLIQVFTKPSELTGVIYELISRTGDGFCEDNVKNLMNSTKDL